MRSKGLRCFAYKEKRYLWQLAAAVNSNKLVIENVIVEQQLILRVSGL